MDNDVREDASNQLRRLMFIRAPEAPFKLVRELQQGDTFVQEIVIYSIAKYFKDGPSYY